MSAGFVFGQAGSARQGFFVDGHFVSPSSVLSTSLLLAALKEARPYATGRLLDVGCGSKPYKQFFAVDRHIGIDWSNSLQCLEVEAFATAEALPFGDCVFDSVLCTEVLEHLRHPEMAIREMARVLKPGGNIIISVPFIHELHEEPFDFLRFTSFGLLSRVEEAGLRPILLRHRGSYTMVLADLLFRILVTYIKAGLRRIPLGRKIETWALNLLVVLPQRGLARIGVTYCKRLKGRMLALCPSPRLTLGYVLVAQLPSDA
jgi:SAM-dependent methyltransferase